MAALGEGDLSEPTLTLDENGCTYSGPVELSTTFTLTWHVADLGHSAYIYTIGTLDQGKSIHDIASMPAVDPAPLWFHKISVDFTPSPGVYTKVIDLSANSLFTGGPIYFACFFPDMDTAVGVDGPIDVIPK
jgi:hypothetical protein